MKYLTPIIIMLILSGCAKINSTGISFLPGQHKDGSLILDKDGEIANAQRVFLWKSNYSAGIATKDGICAQGALSAFSGSAGVDTGKLAGLTIPTIKGDSKVTLVNATNPQTAFANASLFYLCQISLNNEKLQASDIVAMWAETNKAIASVSAGGVPIEKNKQALDNDGKKQEKKSPASDPASAGKNSK